MFLFDDLMRTDVGPRRNVDSNYNFVNRSARPEYSLIRGRLEHWFARYPADTTASLEGRFKSRDDRHHDGALFELMLHALMESQGCHVTASLGSPDFVADLNDERVYMEAAVVSPRTSLFAEDPVEGAVFDAINKMASPNFVLFVDTDGKLDRAPRVSDITNQLGAFMSAYDPDVIERRVADGGDAPTTEIKVGSWTLRAKLIAKSKEGRGRAGRTIGAGPVRGSFVDNSSPLKTAILAKADQFRSPDAPFVIAVNGMAFHDREDELDALFGKQQTSLRIDVPDATPTTTRSRNGVWILGNRARSQHVAAVLFFRGLTPWSMHQAGTRLYVNPYVPVALPEWLLRLPYAVARNGELEWIDGQTVGELLRIPSDWLATAMNRT